LETFQDDFVVRYGVLFIVEKGLCLLTKGVNWAVLAENNSISTIKAFDWQHWRMSLFRDVRLFTIDLHPKE
jgi:hypothetical protein